MFRRGGKLLLNKHRDYIEKRVMAWKQSGLTKEQIGVLKTTMEKAFILYEKRHKEAEC